MYWVKDTKQFEKDRCYHFHHIFCLHPIVLWSPRLIVLWSPCLIVLWSPCLIVLWSPRLIVLWSPRLIVLWSPRLIVLWSPRLIVLWSPRLIVLWSQCLIVLWSPRMIVLWSPHCPYTTVCTCRCHNVAIRHQHTGFKKLQLWTQRFEALNHCEETLNLPSRFHVVVRRGVKEAFWFLRILLCLIKTEIGPTN